MSEQGAAIIRVVIDCDPGHDDALALLAALGSASLRVDAVTTVAGNAPVEQVTDNALRVLALAGVNDVPVYQGAAGPLVRELVTSGNAHGASGLTGPPLPAPARSPAGPAAPWLASWCAEADAQRKVLICTGPLTNIGTLLDADPRALRGVDELFVMGGSLSGVGGRLSPTAETNFFIDPDAADIVLRSGAAVRLYDYDVTTSCLISLDEIARIEWSVPGDVGRYAGTWLRHQHQFGKIAYGRDGVAVHDLYPVAGVAGVGPDRWEDWQLRVDTTDERRGTVSAAPGTGHAVARGLGPAAMTGYFIESVSRLGAGERR